MTNRRIPPGGVRLILWAAGVTYCAGYWVWLKVDDVLHPRQPA